MRLSTRVFIVIGKVSIIAFFGVSLLKGIAESFWCTSSVGYAVCSVIDRGGTIIIFGVAGLWLTMGVLVALAHVWPERP